MQSTIYCYILGQLFVLVEMKPRLVNVLFGVRWSPSQLVTYD